jgi:Rad3-related DNA helicase
MNLKVFLTIAALAAMPTLAHAQQGRPAPSAAKPTKAEVQRVVQIISADKTKTQTYCELGKLNEQIAQAEEKKDNKRLEALAKRADDLAQKIGPEYVKLMDALENIDENSKEGQEFGAMLQSLERLCSQR